MGRVLAAALVLTLMPILAPDAASEPSTDEITLVTGDQVLLRGNAVSPVPGKGRRGMGFRTYEVAGHRYVIPLDAIERVAAGTLDRRLFDLTSLKDFGYAKTPSVPLIIEGNAMTAAKGQSWPSLLTSPDKVWLDGKRELALAESVPQVGAPAVWQSGFTGKGVTVAVLDTGIDATHKDFAGRIADRRDFTDDKDKEADDKNGHGTHVASTIAGSGAASNGKYKGVAPEATLVIGKVCDDEGCPESAILKGMEWAAREKKAQVVNLSLGGPDAEEIDPLEAAINELSAETGALFVVASGNQGPRPESVSSPSTADAALSVGAVGKKDDEAFYSSRGPRIDGAVKPEIAAPGTSIVAALAKNSESEPIDKFYTRSSGTSMATPHVSGAAALLAQQRPGTKSAELKSTLVSSATPLQFDAHMVGAGRLDVARATKQTVVAVNNSVNLGLQRWPHDDDKPVSGTITYRNTGSTPVTLSLATASPYSVAPNELTVPAGGEATATVTADTRTGPDGHITGRLIATAGETRVVTPLTVNKEVESYDLRVTQTGRDGKPAPIVSAVMLGMDSGQSFFPFDMDGSVVLRRPKGRYIVDSHVPAKDSYSHIIVPVLTLDRDQDLTLDARQAKLVKPVVPNAKVGAALLDVGLIRSFPLGGGRGGLLTGAILYDGTPFYSFYQGEPLPPEDLEAWMAFKLAEPDKEMDFTKSPVMYHLLWQDHGTYPTGFEPVVKQEELAEVRQHYHATEAGKFAYTWTLGYLDGLGHTAAGGPIGVHLPFHRTDYFQTGRTWEQSFAQYRDKDADREISNLYSRRETLKPGTSVVRHWNRAVFTPGFDSADAPASYRSTRTGDKMNIFAAPYVDSTTGRTGYPMSGDRKSRIALYRDGALVAEKPDMFQSLFEGLPDAESTYRAELSLQLDEKLFPLSTKTSTAWTFRSAATQEAQALPLMNVRIAPNVDANNAVKVNQLLVIPVMLQRNPGSASANVTDVVIEVSFDDGASWREIPVYPGNDIWYGLEANQVSNSYASLRVTAADEAGNKVEQTVLHAYRVT
ncbi:S8 family peptidase [Kibdelosporangium aridum]|uniref:Serine protease, subtilisin family n=1 Tax=Kibdelosporangium aridum TaxID=2030 RepID=A0A1W2E751_KIBAR|nr:S8 family peptidase [Kibdelosporangium aridum]SMD05584.1 Serine protease, subtilisin family [Kibdelosporangium aridum]